MNFSLERKALVTSGVYDNVPSTHQTEQTSAGKKLIRFSNVIEYPIDIDTPAMDHSSVYYDAKSDFLEEENDLINLKSDELTTSALIDQTIGTIDRLSIGHTPPSSPKSLLAYPIARSHQKTNSACIDPSALQSAVITRDKSQSFDGITGHFSKEKPTKPEPNRNFLSWIPPPLASVSNNRQVNILPMCLALQNDFNYKRKLMVNSNCELRLNSTTIWMSGLH